MICAGLSKIKSVWRVWFWSIKSQKQLSHDFYSNGNSTFTFFLVTEVRKNVLFPGAVCGWTIKNSIPFLVTVLHVCGEQRMTSHYHYAERSYRLCGGQQKSDFWRLTDFMCCCFFLLHVDNERRDYLNYFEITPSRRIWTKIVLDHNRIVLVRNMKSIKDTFLQRSKSPH